MTLLQLVVHLSLVISGMGKSKPSNSGPMRLLYNTRGPFDTTMRSKRFASLRLSASALAVETLICLRQGEYGLSIISSDSWRMGGGLPELPT